VMMMQLSTKRCRRWGRKSLKEASLCLRKTYSDRRQFVAVDSSSVSAIKAKYPILCSVHEMINEFEWIVIIDDVEQLLKTKMEEFAPKILTLKKPKGKQSGNQLYLKALSEVEAGSASDNCELCLALLMLPCALQDDLGVILKNSVCSSTLTPYILIECKDTALFCGNTFTYMLTGSSFAPLRIS
ncbi:hypothetical protein CAPTEDRAFT_189870, partial [Capitella teleta]